MRRQAYWTAVNASSRHPYPMNSIPNIDQSPVTIISTLWRIGEPAVKTVLAITKMRVFRQRHFPLDLQSFTGGRAATASLEVARYSVFASFSRMPISQAADCSTASRCANFSLR